MRRTAQTFVLSWLILVSGGACNAFDPPPAGGGEGGRGLRPAGFAGGPVAAAGAGGGTILGTGPQPGPVDAPDFFPPQAIDGRPVQRADHPLPPIEGGTLLVTRDGSLAVAADPDRDRVAVVDLEAAALARAIELEPLDAPGRMVEDAAGRVHVVLRQAGALATIDVRSGELLSRRELCGAPRGIDYRGASDSVLVACAEGRVVELPAASDAAAERRVVDVELDLQDVVVDGERTYVTTFKRAQLLELDAQGAVTARHSPETLTSAFANASRSSQREARTFEPAVAWAALRRPEGGVAMVHQRAQLDMVEIASSGVVPIEGEPPTGGYGDGGGHSLTGGSADVAGCGAIVQNGVTLFDSDGTVHSLPPISAAVLPVDGALSPDGRFVAVALAGSSLERPDDGSFASRVGTAVMAIGGALGSDECQVPGVLHGGASLATGQATGVAFAPSGRLVVHSRETDSLQIYGDFVNCVLDGCQADVQIGLGGRVLRDTGHDLFHLDAGRGIACASCHPGGGDDGRTWHFSTLGPRRTQLFNMGIAGTEPLHWDGDMATFQQLMAEVFTNRMGGASLSGPRVLAVADFIASLSPNPPLRAADDPAVLRGKALFESSEVGCATCHSGEKLTNNTSVDVGTGGVFQVSSLVGVVYHRPYIHSGCAETLRDRFDPACGGGDQHGQTSQLSEAELDDLVAYLESL